MDDIIEVPLCATCGVREVKPPRRKYCSEECAKVAQRQQQANYITKKRGSSIVESSVERLSKIDTSLVVQKAEIQPLIEFFEAFFFGFTQHIEERNHEVLKKMTMFEEMLDEIFYNIHTHPALKEDLQRNYYQLQESIRIIEENEDTFKLHQIRVIISERLRVSNREAEVLLKKAHHYLLDKRARGQRHMDDFDQEGAS